MKTNRIFKKKLIWVIKDQNNKISKTEQILYTPIDFAKHREFIQTMNEWRKKHFDK